MKQQNTKQYAGVCLDSTQAIIISTDVATESTDYTILEKVKAGSEHSGGSEHTMNNAKQADQQKYFKLLSNSLSAFDEILIFGPGKSQEQFQNFLNEDAQFKQKKISIDSAEKLTDPQMIAKVREFFKNHQS